MDEDGSSSIRRMSTRARKVAPKMAAALASSDNRTQVDYKFYFLGGNTISFRYGAF